MVGALIVSGVSMASAPRCLSRTFGSSFLLTLLLAGFPLVASDPPLRSGPEAVPQFLVDHPMQGPDALVQAVPEDLEPGPWPDLLPPPRPRLVRQHAATLEELEALRLALQIEEPR